MGGAVQIAFGLGQFSGVDRRRRCSISTFSLSSRRLKRHVVFRVHLASSRQKNPVPELKPEKSNETTKESPSFGRLWRRFGNNFKLDQIGLDVVSIALPAVLSLAADPIASLVDTAFVGHLGSAELAAVGISASVFNLVSKLFNVPLLNVTTSFVAEEQAREKDSKYEDSQGKKYLPAVSTSLALAAGVGILEAIALSYGSGFLMNSLGVSVDSPMRVPAEQFLTFRAWGAPPIVIALAAQGAFRGFMDTKTPLLAVGTGTLVNAVLDPILIFFLSLGIEGAAIATVLSEYIIAYILILNLSKNVLLFPWSFDMKKTARYLQSGGLLIGRTIAVLMTMTLSTSLAAQGGTVSMAAHEICLQIWLAVSLLNDALALAGQAILANVYTQGNYKEAETVISRVLQMGLVMGTSLAIALFFGFAPFSTLFTTDPDVLEIAQSGLLFVTISQPVNALAFVFDGLYYGLSDFSYAAYSMVLVSLLSSLFLLAATPLLGLPGVWTGLFLFMLLRVLAGFWRLHSKKGPWKFIHLEERGK
ncbi:MATE efflux family protein [Wolffia australiana]